MYHVGNCAQYNFFFQFYGRVYNTCDTAINHIVPIKVVPSFLVPLSKEKGTLGSSCIIIRTIVNLSTIYST